MGEHGRYVVRGRDAAGAPPPERPGASGRLARLVDARARDEADALGLTTPDAPAVPWTADLPGGGGLPELALAVRRLPVPHLAITGDPGAGTSSLALLLTRALLRLPGPVPVPLSAASWDATLEPLTAWLARRLRQEYGLPGPVARRLAESGDVLPLIDGTDELPPPARQSALAALRDALDDGLPLIVLLRPVSLAELGPAPVAVLRAQPVDGATPLALWLARRYGPAHEPDRFARLLTRLRTDEFAWWRAHRARAATVARAVLLVLYAVVLGASAAAGPVVPVAAGVAGGLLAHLAFLSRDGQPRRPARLFGVARPEPAVAVRAVVLLAAVPLLFSGGAAPTAVGAAGAAVLALSLGVPAETALVAGPLRLLRGERASALLTALLAAPVAAGLAGGAPGAALPGAVTALLLSPWCRWLTARTVLAVTGALPWAALPFLEAAADAGLLRRTAGAYAFRHVLLRPRPVAGEPPGDHARFTGHTGARVRRGQPALYVPLWAAGAWGAAVAEGAWAWAAVALCLLLPPAFDLVVVPLVRRPAALHLNGDWIAVVSGDRRLALAWADVAEVAVRGGEGARGRYEPVLHVRLAPGVVPGPAMRVADGGWIALWPLGRGGVGQELDGALTRFAGGRWAGGLG